MDLLDILKQFKNISPDEGFTKRSRDLILREHGALPNFLSMFKSAFEVGASLALAGLMIFIIFGGLASVRFFSPLEITALDPVSIKAEAEAIDFQIKLAGLDYKESASPSPGRESTISSAPSVAPEEKITAEPSSESIDLSIDEALDLLSK